jgi:hypothetical protein
MLGGWSRRNCSDLRKSGCATPSGWILALKRTPRKRKAEVGYTKVQTDFTVMGRASDLPYGWLADRETHLVRLSTEARKRHPTWSHLRVIDVVWKRQPVRTSITEVMRIAQRVRLL